MAKINKRQGPSNRPRGRGSVTPSAAPAQPPAAPPSPPAKSAPAAEWLAWAAEAGVDASTKKDAVAAAGL